MRAGKNVLYVTQFRIKGKEMLKKQVLIIILNFFVIYTSFGQYFDYVSLGYNTVETVNERGEEISTWYYFLNSQFSKMALERFYDGVILFEEKANDGPREGVLIGDFSGGGFFHHTYFGEGYYFDGLNEIYRTVDGKLVYLELNYSGDKYFSRKIEYTSSGLTVYMDKRMGVIKKFYNIPEDELYDKFISALVQRIKVAISDEYLYRASSEDYIYERLKKMTKNELAIFRNCLFAKHEYAFHQPVWQEFMNKYYNNFTSYRGSYSNTEVLNQLSDVERWVLELILKYEK
jgi:hypothetical protein